MAARTTAWIILSALISTTTIFILVLSTTPSFNLKTFNNIDSHRQLFKLHRKLLQDSGTSLSTLSSSHQIVTSPPTAGKTLEPRSIKHVAAATTITNPHPFEFIINEPEACSLRQSVFLLVFIHSAPSHYKRRMAIRETWGSRKVGKELKTVVLFSLGDTEDKTLKEAIQLESNLYHDVLQESFIDSYHNLTYKAIGWLKWTRDYCSNAKFVLKTDDDIFTNIFLLTRHLDTLVTHNMEPVRSLICLVWWRMHVYREGKWGISKEVYKSDLYPVYCSGSAYILTSDIIADMYNVSQYVDFFWVDDVYITGMLPKALGNVTHRSLESVYVFKQDDFARRFYGRVGKGAGTGIFGHVGKVNLFYQIWNKILNRMERTDLIEDKKSYLPHSK